ncbi:unnamed protein product, partial [Porites evermanni]
QNLKPARADDPLAEFSFFLHQRLQVSKKFSFQELSTTECARLCLQVTEQLNFNCSSFEYEVTKNDCFLMGSSCLHHQLIYDGLRDYYELKAPNGTSSCNIRPSSSSLLTTNYLKKTTEIHATPAVSSVLMTKPLSAFNSSSKTSQTGSLFSSFTASTANYSASAQIIQPTEIVTNVSIVDQKTTVKMSG